MEYTYIFLLILIHNVARASCQTYLEDVSVYRDFILVSQARERRIYQLSLDGSNYRTVATKDDGLCALDYDPTEKVVYYGVVTDGYGAVYKVGINGQNSEIIIMEQGLEPVSIAVDPVARLLFYANKRQGSIHVVSLNNKTKYKTLVFNIASPTSIRLDPPNRQIYWSDSIAGRIERATYDGNNRVVLINNNDSIISAISIDTQEYKLYWIANNSIHRSDLDGKNHRVFYSGDEMSKFSNVYASLSYIYYTDLSASSVMRVNKAGGITETIGPRTLSQIRGLLVFSELTYTKSIDPTLASCGLGLANCSDICIPIVGSTLCVCPDNYRLAPDGKSCSLEEHANGPDVIWVERNELANSAYVRGITGEPQDYLSGHFVRTWSLESPDYYWSAVDANYHTSSLYMIDRADRYIVRMTLSGTKSLTEVYHGVSGDCDGIAVDWTTGNIYWTDALYNWIMMTNAYSATRYTRTMVRRLDRPHGISLSPKHGIMVWTDWGDNPRVEKASMAGENRQSLIDTDLQYPMGVVIDTLYNRIYWTSPQKVESVSIDGTNRRAFVTFQDAYLAAISIQNDMMFLVDQGTSVSEPMIRFVNVSQPSSQLKYVLTNKPYGITMYHRDRQPSIPSDCTSLGCLQLCVSLGQGRGRCVCQDSFNLHNDSRTCIETDIYSDRVYVYSLSNRLCILSIQNATSRLIQTPHQCFLHLGPNDGYYKSLDFNYNRGAVYFTKILPGQSVIGLVNLRNRNVFTALLTLPGKIGGISYDWVADNLYWTNETDKKIHVARGDGSYISTLLSASGTPSSIVVDPTDRHVYWVDTSAATSSVIKRGNMDLSDTQIYVNDSSSVVGLNIDHIHRRLLWVNPREKTIYSQSLTDNARSRQKLVTPNDLNPIDVATLEDYVVFTNRQTNGSGGVRVVVRETGVEVTNGVFDPASTPYDVIAIDDHNQPPVTNAASIACGTDNGGCEQICMLGKSTHSCRCQDDMMLHTDGKMCIVDRQGCQVGIALWCYTTLSSQIPDLKTSNLSYVDTFCRSLSNNIKNCEAYIGNCAAQDLNKVSAKQNELYTMEIFCGTEGCRDRVASLCLQKISSTAPNWNKDSHNTIDNYCSKIEEERRTCDGYSSRCLENLGGSFQQINATVDSIYAKCFEKKSAKVTSSSYGNRVSAGFQGFMLFIVVKSFMLSR